VRLYAADEPIDPRGKRSTGLLTRRVKQGVAEWYVTDMLERSWDGFKVHTGQGWNIGKPPYGYAADKVQHPVPAKAAEGQTKTRLGPDPHQAPVVAYIFRLRVVERLGYDAIAARLNTDPDRYPVPEPTSAHRRRGVWSGSAVRDVLHNPKYTGYMVWNRRATKSGGRVNPPSAWVWSDEPTHGAARRPGHVRGRRRRLTHNARLPSRGRTQRRSPRHEARLPPTLVCPMWSVRPAHVRQDPSRSGLLQLLPGQQQRRPPRPLPTRPPQGHLRPRRRPHRGPGPRHRYPRLQPDRRAFIRRGHAGAPNKRQEADTRRASSLREQIADLTARQDRLIEELETADGTFRDRLRRRFDTLEADRTAKLAQLHDLETTAVVEPEQALDLLDALPILETVNITGAPEPLQRKLYDALQLTIHYDRPDQARFRLVLTDDTINALAASAGTGAAEPTTRAHEQGTPPGAPPPAMT